MEKKAQSSRGTCRCGCDCVQDAVCGGARGESGCIAACPECLRTCTLDLGHYGSHHCSQGHRWL
ncbi:MAG: hypothetical protein GX598_01390 [Elusimicrobia bacterium]|nr:hypothetical protein [Elusimicrobiota bacterium]